MTSEETALLIDTALRNAGLDNYAHLASQRVLLEGDSANLRSCIRIIRDIGIPAPLVSRGAQWLLIAMTVSSVLCPKPVGGGLLLMSGLFRPRCSAILTLTSCWLRCMYRWDHGLKPWQS